MVMNTALPVIDVQLGNFLEPYPVHEGSRLLERVKGLIDKARSAQTQIIYVQNNGGKGEILANSKEINGLRACDRVQIVVDLFSGGYGRDAAVEFLEVIQNGAEENTG
jgi:nicotinamidase-related amidase